MNYPCISFLDYSSISKKYSYQLWFILKLKIFSDKSQRHCQFFLEFSGLLLHLFKLWFCVHYYIFFFFRCKCCCYVQREMCSRFLFWDRSCTLCSLPVELFPTFKRSKRMFWMSFNRRNCQHWNFLKRFLFGCWMPRRYLWSWRSLCDCTS